MEQKQNLHSRIVTCYILGMRPDVKAIIQGMGGAARLAEQIGARRGTVSVWKSRNRIPGKWWHSVAAASTPDYPVTVADLAAIHATREGEIGPW